MSVSKEEKKYTKNLKWTTSRDSIGERFDGDYFETKEEAIESVLADIEKGDFDGVKEQGFFWVGQIIEHAPDAFLDADQLIDNAWEMAGDEAGEFADDYLQDVTKEQKDELQKLLRDWVIKNHLEPDFFKIVNSEKVTLKET